MRAPLAGLLLLGMRVILPSFHTGALLSVAPEAEAALDALLTAFPGSALPLWMSGRLLRMQARLADAAAAFAASGAADSSMSDTNSAVDSGSARKLKMPLKCPTLPTRPLAALSRRSDCAQRPEPPL